MLAITLSTKKEIYNLMIETEARYLSLYDEFACEIEKHANSDYAIPNVTKGIADNSSSVQAFKLLAVAHFEGQKLTNAYQLIYAPKLNDLYHNGDMLMRKLYNSFANDAHVQEIKTSAEKERQYSTFSYEVNEKWCNIKHLATNVEFFGKYVNNIVYSLNRLQSMLDSIDKMRSQELWNEDTITKKTMDIIGKDINDSDFDEW